MYVTKTVKNMFGKYDIVIGHDESNVVLFPLGEDGSIDDPVDIFKLDGSGPKSFQMSSHAHSIMKAPLADFYAVCDKGGDQIYTLYIDYEQRGLRQCHGSPIKREPGTAPRHCVFHPTKPYFFANKEAKTVASAFSYDENGKLTGINRCSSLPDYMTPPEGIDNTGICIDQEGKYLYDLMKVEGLVSVFEIDKTGGAIKRIQSIKLPYDDPRGAAISPDGKYLLVACLKGNHVVSYALKGGRLAESLSAEFACPSPGNLAFFQI
jgi:6-phosphogluconolactonase